MSLHDVPTTPPTAMAAQTPATYPGLYRGVLERVQHMRASEFASYIGMKGRRDRRFAWAAGYWMMMFSLTIPVLAFIMHPAAGVASMALGAWLPFRAVRAFRREAATLSLNPTQQKFIEKHLLGPARHSLFMEEHPGRRDPLAIGQRAEALAADLFGSFDDDER